MGHCSGDSQFNHMPLQCDTVHSSIFVSSCYDLRTVHDFPMLRSLFSSYSRILKVAACSFFRASFFLSSSSRLHFPHLQVVSASHADGSFSPSISRFEPALIVDRPVVPASFQESPRTFHALRISRSSLPRARWQPPSSLTAPAIQPQSCLPTIWTTGRTCFSLMSPSHLPCILYARSCLPHKFFAPFT